ncbi:MULTISPECIES: DUF3127 domain-containing protein [Salibacter]|jgi:hypothetical protein|uniref:DUF3127 domain-containing protein n=1 Tax=Salibacter halophilus TaxID=1803916 RepID=A0A6N6M631_9FLAO|nr:MULTISPECIES: DUF3127 domain-containing protein [Salibacter]KAB1063823.1 DUF3127 domain-containing protein [Salibacter halophilus]MDR9397834.1 DUF3127 domain-containing protein [Salibacter sp.]MDR9487083.1 DUF3127 domain-containing protein [Salibacter sp.]
MDIHGKIKEIFDAQEFKSGFKKREFVVTTQEQYPQDIKLELYNDKCDMIDGHQKGEEVTVHFNLRGNEYNGRYFVNLNAWKIEKAEAQAKQGGGPSMPPPPPENDAAFDVPADDNNDDDLPF